VVLAALLLAAQANAAALSAGGAKSAVVLEAASGRVLFQANPDEPLPMPARPRS
jgi:D-alanyl-D-alanine carboxypeptidase